MEKERLIKKLTSVYTQIINALVNPTFRFSQGGATQKTLAKFIDMMEQEFGVVTEERLVDVCIFTAYIYQDLNRTVKQLFGKTTLTKFLQRKSGQMFYEDQWLAKKNLKRSQFIKKIADRSVHPSAKYIYVASEEYTKKRCLNRAVGYVICQSSTLGWSPLSESCQQCEFSSQCHIETQRKYPEIYRLRLEYVNNIK